MAVKEAIEKSVQSLIYEGILQRIWTSADSTATRSGPMQNYLREKEENLAFDALGRETQYRRRPFGIGLNGVVQLYQGDFALPQYRLGASLDTRYQLGHGPFSGFLTVGTGKLAAGPQGQYFDQRFNYAELGLLAYLFPSDRFSPYLLAGVGATSRSGATSFTSKSNLLPHGLVGIGGELMLTSRLGLNLRVDNHFYVSDRLDLITQGNYNDYYWGGQAGLILYLTRKKAVTPAEKP
jgi:curli production assembly/transport component CsgG